MNSMITTCLNTLAKNFHTKNRNPINNNAPIVSATFIVNPSIASPHKVRDRGSKIEDRRSHRISLCDLRSSIFDSRSSILDPRSSILDPRSSISDRQKIERPSYQKSDAHEIAENFRAVFDALLRSVMFVLECGGRHRDQHTE